MTAVEEPVSVLLGRDLQLMAEAQPDLRHAPAADGSAAFVGDFVFKLASGSPQRIPTRIEFGANYPDDEPRAFHLGTRFPHDGDHHFYPSGRCCLWLDVETRWKPSDPESLRRFLDELTAYYLRQLMMEANPKLTWPGRARGHGYEGHLEHLKERLHMTLEQMPIMLGAFEGAVNRNAPCPCGRRVRYRKCHRNTIVRFRKLADPGSQQQVVQLLRKIKAAEPSRRKARRDEAAAKPRKAAPVEPVESKTVSKPTRVTLDTILAKVTARSPSRSPA
jgi:hypothetical protein